LKLPDFPWDALAPYGQRARAHPQGGIDLSQGTPVDPTPEFIQTELKASANSPSYPVTTGSKELRESLINYCRQVLGATGEFDVLPTIGSKEMVALLPFLLEAKRVLIPRIAYPTYKVGGLLAKAEVIEVDIDPASWPTEGVDLVWLNTPSNPTGRVHSDDEMRAVLKWSRSHGITIASDECYLPFPDQKRGTSLLKFAEGENENLLALHSLSKRSNLAGYRAAFVAGDNALVGRLLEIRKHMGMMVPLPVQRAMAKALGDETHVTAQAELYRARRKKLSSALIANGFKVEGSEAGLYIWCTRGESDWESVAWFAERGIIVTPGNFYGDAGKMHIRIALTATDANIDEAVSRIGAN
jgi:succinyldiaminopimelate transaminase